MLMNAQQARQTIKSIKDTRKKVVLDEICNALEEKIKDGEDSLWVPRKHMYPDFIKYFKELGYEVIYYPYKIDSDDYYDYSYFMKEYKHDKTAYLITVNNNKYKKLKPKKNGTNNQKSSMFSVIMLLLLIGFMICCYCGNGRTLSQVID